MFIAMTQDKPIIFRSVKLSIKDNNIVELSSEGVRDLMLNLSRIVDTKDAVSSNPADTFEALIGSGKEDDLNLAARAALSAAHALHIAALDELNDILLSMLAYVKRGP
jgi:hypothetical protein